MNNWFKRIRLANRRAKRQTEIAAEIAKPITNDEVKDIADDIECSIDGWCYDEDEEAIEEWISQLGKEWLVRMHIVQSDTVLYGKIRRMTEGECVAMLYRIPAYREMMDSWKSRESGRLDRLELENKIAYLIEHAIL